MWSRGRKKGFMLLELLVGIFILVVGVVGIHSFVYRFFVYNRYLASKMTAAYLTQEGIEIVRKIRDSNWLSGNAWDQDILCCGCNALPCECNCEADHDSVSLSEISFPNHKLEIDSQGFFGYSAGRETDFERIINVRKMSSDLIEVCVTTQWGRETSNYQVKACDKLYNWYYNI